MQPRRRRLCRSLFRGANLFVLPVIALYTEKRLLAVPPQVARGQAVKDDLTQLQFNNFSSTGAKNPSSQLEVQNVRYSNYYPRNSKIACAFRH